MLPEIETDLKITVNALTMDGKSTLINMSKTIKEVLDNNVFGKRFAIDLKKLKDGAKDVSGENWVSIVPNSTYVSQMSIPGSYDSANFVEGTDGNDRTQTKSFDSEWKNILS